MKYVLVDWRPYELPEVFGPFETEEAAKQFGRNFADVGSNEELPDGIDVRDLNAPITP